MSNTQIISAKAKKIVDNMLDSIQRLGISTEPNRMLVAYLYSRREDADKDVMESVKHYTHLFAETVFPSNADLSTLEAEYRTVIQYCLSKSVIDKYNPHHLLILPNEAIDLMLKLAHADETSSVLITATEQPNLMTGMSHLNCDVQLVYSNMWAFMQILADSLDSSDNLIINHAYRTTECMMQQNRYDYIFAFYPLFGVKDEAKILRSICEYTEYILSEKGELYCFLPAAVMNLMSNKSFRESLIAQKTGITIIQLPPLFPSVTNVQMVLLKVSKRDPHEIMLVDTEFSNRSKNTSMYSCAKRIVSAIASKDNKQVWTGRAEELDSNLSLKPSRYLIDKIVEPKKGEKLVTLSEIITLCTKQLPSSTALKETVTVNLKDLSTNYLNCSLNYPSLLSENQKPSFSVMEGDCYLFSCFGTSLRVGQLVNSYGKAYFVHREIIPFKLKESAINLVSEEFLLKALLEESTAMQIEALSDATLIRRLCQKDFLALQISLPSLKQQEQIIKDDIHQNMSDSEKRLNDMFRTYKKEISSRKHRMGQGFSAFSANWEILCAMMEIKEGHLNREDVINPDNGMTVGDVMGIMKRQVNLIAQQLDHLSDIEYDFGEAEELELGSFIHHFIETHRDTRFSFEEQYDPKQYKEIPIDCLAKLKFAPKAMETVFENIVSNAVSHGFTDPERKDYRIRFEESFIDIDCYEIRISNNGNPIPADINPDDIFLYGFSAASAGENHSGIGCADTRSILERYHATVSILSTPDKEFTVTYIITFHQNMLDGE